MLFQYLRKPTPTDLLTSPESFKYFEYGMFCMGWHTPAKYKALYYTFATFIFGWCVVYLPIGISISFVKDLRTGLLL